MMHNDCWHRLRHLAKAMNYTSAFSLRSELRDIFLNREKYRECFPFAIALDIFMSKSFDRQPVSEQINISYKPEEALWGIFELTEFYNNKNMGMHAYMAAALGMDIIKKHKIPIQLEITAKYYKMMTAFELGFSDEVIRYYNELLAKESEIPREIRLGYYNAMGLISAQFPGDDHKAIDYYKKAIHEANIPQKADIIKINFADYYYGREKFGKALKLLDGVISTNFASIRGYLNTLRLKIYLQISQDDECKKVAKELEELNKKREDWIGNWRSFIFLGHYYAKIGDHIRASHYLNKLKNVEDFKFNSYLQGEALVLEASLELAKKNSIEGLKKIIQAFQLLSSYKTVSPHLRGMIKNLLNSVVNIFSQLIIEIRSKDPYTASHTLRVASIAHRMGEKLALSKIHLFYLVVGAMLHDYGKIMIPTYILNKPAKLSLEEYKIVKMHPEYGASKLEKMRFPQEIINVVLYHHERGNGSGYPAGLKLSDIPFLAQIVAVADVYDALTTDRPYRKALNKKEALAYIIEQGENLAKKEVISAFSKCLKKGIHQPDEAEFADIWSDIIETFMAK
ncbi:hypothetical protein AT15_05035 [Kosmotoga arenicorallina S304]|uniref:Uncharacterized protein n=1 Tax=Kosmotoga arenicorallina S304 TaxID=1453497 RepID=A0A176JVJ6_9BACT|nr:HD domain-containing phosphohydrolase [Kosmotoga arenicorallina]OAA27584.1 hypothetical protein AT15_05035 [Kosmotoga arenicorallina S304]